MYSEKNVINEKIKKNTSSEEEKYTNKHELDEAKRFMVLLASDEIEESKIEFLDTPGLKEDNGFEKKMEFFNYIHFVCKECCTIPKIEFKSEDTLNYCCNCNIESINPTIKNIKKEFIKQYILSKEELMENKKENLILVSFFCNKHIKKYKYFCNNCRKNLCRKCLKNENHIGHDLIIFDSLLNELDLKIEDIKKKLNINPKNELNKDIFDNLNFKDNIIGYKHLFMIIINDYYEYQNYNIIKSIENIYDFLNNKNTKNMETSEIANILKEKVQNGKYIYINEINLNKSYFTKMFKYLFEKQPIGILLFIKTNGIKLIDDKIELNDRFFQSSNKILTGVLDNIKTEKNDKDYANNENNKNLPKNIEIHNKKIHLENSPKFNANLITINQNKFEQNSIGRLSNCYFHFNFGYSNYNYNYDYDYDYPIYNCDYDHYKLLFNPSITIKSLNNFYLDNNINKKKRLKIIKLRGNKIDFGSNN